MKSLNFHTYPYRKCEAVHKKLVENKLESISQRDLRRIISEYCASSKIMIKEYEKRFVEFGFLKKDSKNLNTYQVNHELFFSSNEAQGNKSIHQNATKENQTQNNPSMKTLDSSFFSEKSGKKNFQSKTVVYPTESEKKVTLSFKGYKSIWQKYKQAIWDYGFPDICYVEHIIHSAILSATKEANGNINIPFKLGSFNFFVTINAPYVVKRPRRYRKHTKREVIDEDIKWE